MGTVQRRMVLVSFLRTQADIFKDRRICESSKIVATMKYNDFVRNINVGDELLTGGGTKSEYVG